LVIIALASASCSSSVSIANWKDVIPKESISLYVPKDAISLPDFLKSDEASTFSTFGSAPFGTLGQTVLLSYVPNKLQAAVAVPVDADHWESLFVVSAELNLAKAVSEKNIPDTGIQKYSHNSVTIYRVVTDKMEFYCAQIENIALLSQNSLPIERAIESAISAKKNPSVFANIEQQEESASWVLNVENLASVISQNLKVLYRPSVLNLFDGFGISTLTFSKDDDVEQFDAKIPINNVLNHPFSQAINYENKAIVLDEYISSNASHFSLFRNSPLNLSITKEQLTGAASKLDSAILYNDILRANLLSSIELAFGIVSFDESGFSEKGEFLWLRHLKDSKEFYTILERMANSGLITREDDLYMVNSQLFAEILSSGMATSNRFYLGVNYEVAVMADRIGLCKSVAADRSRRRVLRYDASWKEVYQQIPSTFSSLHIANSNELNRLLQNFLRAGSYLQPLFNRFDIAMAYTTISTETDKPSLAFKAKLYQSNNSYIPYEENWLFPLFNESLSGPIITSDLGGSDRDELVFSTNTGKVYVIASDGTQLRQMQTEEADAPIGGPIVYDWYGNGLKTVLLAAGNKIYAWDNQGNPLPRFPIVLDEKISAPITLEDIGKNGSVEIIVATADRKLHLLDAKGENLRGWPKVLNASTSIKPIFKIWRNIPSIFVSAQNVLHAFLPNGNERSAYPIFFNSDLSTEPYFDENHILLGDQSGSINTVGFTKYFTGNYFSNDTQIISSDVDSLTVGRVEFGGTSIVGNLTTTDVKMYQPNDSMLVSDHRLVFQAFSGQIYFMNQKAEIVQQFEMGEFISDENSPIITDLYKKNKPHLIAVSTYGRVQGWDLANGRRLISLPSASIQYPILVDMNGDGIMELIANASEGIRSWNLRE
jgi:hypothetical protein